MHMKEMSTFSISFPFCFAGAEGVQSECRVFCPDSWHTLSLCRTDREGVLRWQFTRLDQYHCRLMHTPTSTPPSFFPNNYKSFFFLAVAAPVSLEVSLVNKTTSSICISWSAARGLVNTHILSIKNRTSVQELIITHQEPRSVDTT